MGTAATMCLTLGVAVASAAAATVPAVAIHSVVEVPKAAAAGPATISPSGWNASEPNQS